MKIGIVCPYNMALGGAVQEIVKESNNELKLRGHDVAVITPLPQQGETDVPNMRLIYVGKGKDVKALGTVAQTSWVDKPQEIVNMLEHEQFDVLHVHEPWVPVMNRFVLSQAKCPVVATFHAKLPDNLTANLIKTIGQVYTLPIIKYVTESVAVSEPAREHIQSLVKTKIPIIPNGVNLEEFYPAESPESLHPEKKTLLFVGRIEERKGVRQLLKAYKVFQQNHHDTRLLIGGKGAQLEEMKQLADLEKIKDVEFLGFVEDADKKDMMRRADLFIAPAPFGESFGIIVAEALASGQVVVAGNNPGYASVMTGEGEQCLVDPNDTDALVKKIEALLYDDELRSKLKAWGRDHVRQYSYKTVIDQYEEIFNRVTQDAKAASRKA